MSPAFTGAKAIGAYRIEDSFNGGAGGNTFETFGRNVSVDTFEGVNNGVELFEFCQRSPTQVVEQSFEGSFSVSFVLSTWSFLDLFDDTTEDTDGDTNPEYGFETPQSFELIVSRKDATTTSDTRIATGCIPQSLSIDSQVDGTVEVTIDGIYADEAYESVDTSNYGQVASGKDALNFADVSLSYDGGTLALPRGITINIDNQMNLLSTLGSRKASEFTVGPLTGSLDITHAVEVDETTTLESMYGGTSVSETVSDDTAIDITFDNTNASGSGQVKAVWNFTGFTEDYSESGIDVEEDFIEADVTETIKGGVNVEVTED